MLCSLKHAMYIYGVSCIISYEGKSSPMGIDITANLIDDVLANFSEDNIGLPNTNETRAKELKNCDTSFEVAFRMITVKHLKECYVYGIYRNSFSKWRSRLDESGRISLADTFRNK